MSDHAAGIQDLSHEQYLAAKGVSASMLKVIRESTPLHLLWQMQNPPEPTESQRFGTLVHAAILQPDITAYYVKPRGLDGRTKDGKAWLEQHADLPVLDADRASAIDAMKASVHRHPSAARVLKNSEFERSLFVNDDHGTLRKLRPDILPSVGNVLPDLKTCEDASPDAFSKAIANYGYWVQAAYYLDGCKLLGREYEFFAFIAVEKTPPYACAFYTLDPDAIKAGCVTYQRDLDTYRRCLETNEWPGYSDKPVCLGLPAWAMKQAEEYL